MPPADPVPLTEQELDRLEEIASGTYTPPAKAPFELSSAALYGGVVGLRLPGELFKILPGLTLARSYAHVIAPFIVAFAPPAHPRAPHPGPWAPLHGRGVDINAELRLAAGCEPLGFDRLNTLWFVLALLRLRTAQSVHMPVLCDRALETVPSAVEASHLLPVELQIVRPATSQPREVDIDDLSWVKTHIMSADALMREPVFNRAFQALDQAVAVENAGAGIVIAWAAIETLIRPGHQRITERKSRGLATYLNDPGPARDRAFAQIVTCYEARGGAAHAGRQPESSEFQTAFGFARAALMRAIERGSLPDIEVLLDQWRSKT